MEGFSVDDTSSSRVGRQKPDHKRNLDLVIEGKPLDQRREREIQGPLLHQINQLT